MLVGLWIRLKVDETPVFKQAERNLGQDPARKLPFLDAIKVQWKEILIAGGALASLFSLFYMGTSFLTSYATRQLGYSMTFVLSMGLLAAVLFGLSIAASAMWSDKIGRRKVIMTSCALAIIWTLLLFPMLDSGSTFLYVVGLIGTLLIFGIAYGPAGAALPEMFKARYRYTGAGLGYNLAGVLGGAIPPLIAAEFVRQGNSMAIGIMLAVLSTISVLCAYLMVESKDRDMETGSTYQD